MSGRQRLEEAKEIKRRVNAMLAKQAAKAKKLVENVKKLRARRNVLVVRGQKRKTFDNTMNLYASKFKKLNRDKKRKNFETTMNAAAARFKRASVSDSYFVGNKYQYLPKKLNTNRTKYTKIANKILKDLEKVESKLQNRPLDRPFILKQLQKLNTLVKNTKEEFAIDLHNRISSGLNQNSGKFYYDKNTPLVNVSQLNKKISTSNIKMYTQIIKSIKNNNLQKTTKFPAIVNMDAALMAYNTQLRFSNKTNSYRPPNATKEPNVAAPAEPPQVFNQQIENEYNKLSKKLNYKNSLKKPSRPQRVPGPTYVEVNGPANRTNNYQRLPTGPGLRNRAKQFLKNRRNKAAAQALQNNINAAEYQKGVNKIKKNVSQNNLSK